jgi:hypothetical protein
MASPERFEQLIAFLSSNLHQPIDQRSCSDGSITFTSGAPGEVVVHLTHRSVMIAEFAGAWESPHSFAVRPRPIGVLKWRRLPETELFNALGHLIKGAREARRARYRTCRYCEAASPPEWMGADDVCLGCCTRQMDVVH